MQKILREAEFVKAMVRDMPSAAGMLDSTELPSESMKFALAVVVSGPMLVIFPFFQKYFAGEVLGNNISEGKCSISYSDGTSFLGRTGTVRRVYIYDPEKKIMKRGSLSDVSKGDYIFGGMRYQQISEIIIFKSIF